MPASSLFQRPRRRFPEMEPGRRALVIAGLIASALLFIGGFATSAYLWSLSRQFPQAPFAQPSRLYGAATRLTPGAVLSAGEMVAELKGSGYREEQGEAEDGDPARPPAAGTYRRQGDRVSVHLRRFTRPDGERAGGTVVTADFRGARVARVEVGGRAAGEALLEPPLLASFYDENVEERRPVLLAELPDPVVKTVLAAEDSGFFIHPGVSPTGIARAVWANLRGGGFEQGGSTITQQLVKNVYLSSKRTLTRKAKEALIAVVMEVRHGKKAILEAYLNEIYLGRSGPANLIGFGAASRAYFGKDPAELSLEEAATLAGMIQSPASYSPVEHPDKAKERRDYVLQRMAELGWITQDRLRVALAAPVVTHPQPVRTRTAAPYFADFAAAEAKERFGADELGGKGYLLFSTLRWRDQRQAEAAVEQGLAALDGRRARKHALQAALVSLDPRDGAVLAWVGGRDYARSQFDRVAQARRQVGSAFKPVVYAAAFAEGVANPATLFQDSPINVRMGNASWQPQNYDRAFHGWVTARTALEQSLNIPTVRLALQVGVPNLVEEAREMGFEGDPDPRPALALGALDSSPLEVAQVYSTLAAGGTRQPVHALAAVVDPDGEPNLGEDLPAPRRAVAPQAAYLVTSVLQGVIDHGTGASARGLGPVAGKTGTTNDRRDNWFAGYSPDRVTVVWVGYDDNAPTSLSGARAALPLWARFMAAVRPAGGYRDFPVPAGIIKATVDPTTGQLATDLCPYRVTEVFAEWQAPAEPCHRHSPGYGSQYADLTLGEPLLDPETGQPIDPSSTEEDPRWAITDDGLKIVGPGSEDYAEAEPLPDTPAKTFPPRPVPAEAGVGTGDGAILIRPVRERPTPPPAAPPPAEEVGTGVVPADTRAVGGPAPEVGAAPAASPETTEEGPPPPGPSLP